MWIRIDCIRIRIRIHKVLSIRIQVNKITKFSKHLLISSLKYELSEEVAVSKYQHLLFFRFRLENYFIFLRKKIVIDKLCVSLYFISYLDPDPDSLSGSGSTNPNESGSDRIRIHITGIYSYMTELSKQN